MTHQPFHHWLKSQRRGGHSSAGKFAALIGVESGEYGHWEAGNYRGRKPPGYDDCKRIADGLGLTHAEVWERAAWAHLRDENVRNVFESEIGRLTKERDNAKDNLKSWRESPEIRAAIEAELQRYVATRADAAEAHLLIAVRQLAARLNRTPDARADEPADEAAEMAEFYRINPVERSAEVIEALLAVVATALEREDQGRGLIGALLTFRRVIALEVRGDILDAFAAAAGAAWKAKEWGRRESDPPEDPPDPLPIIPEEQRLGNASTVAIRHAKVRAIISRIGLAIESAGSNPWGPTPSDPQKE